MRSPNTSHILQRLEVMGNGKVSLRALSEFRFGFVVYIEREEVGYCYGVSGIGALF